MVPPRLRTDMSTNPLFAALEDALASRHRRSVPTTDLLCEMPATSVPDLFSNDYLSLTTNPALRELSLTKLSESTLILGSGGSRILNGNTPAHVAFERRMKESFDAPSALLFNSGYDANVAFWHSVPQRGDAVIMDELVHASTRDGLAECRAKDALYTFSHNSPSSFRECVLRVLEKHPSIATGQATVFIAVESLYSMDGDFAPLPDIVRIVDELVPRECRHILVDEAHSTGICGRGGRGLVVALNLEEQIDTVLHTFGKARAASGAVFLTSPVVRKYIINYGRPFIYSTSLPGSSMSILDASFDYIEGPTGAELRDRLLHLSGYFNNLLKEALKHVPPNLLSLRARPTPDGFPSDILSPIFPILTQHPKSLATYLRRLGYPVRHIPYPVVPRGEERIRIVLHAGNNVEELKDLVTVLLRWAAEMQSV